MRLRRLALLCVSLLVTIVVTAGLLVAWCAGLGLEEPPARVDAAVVLGAAVWPGGVPSPVLARRARRAAELFREGRVRGVVTTGGVGRTQPSEGEATRRYLVGEEHVAPEAIEVESSSHTTHENLHLARPLLERRGWRTVLVVTDGYHLARAVAIARDLGLRAWGVPAEGSIAQSFAHNPRRRLSEPWLLLLHVFARLLSPR